MSRLAILPCLAAMLAVIATSTSGCRRDRQSDAFPRHETVYVGGRQWGEPSTFNPLEGHAAWPVLSYDGSNLFYETLLVFNPLDGGLKPLLAESYEVKDDRVDVVLQPKARWSDGKPVSAWDVKYTYDLARDHKSLSHSGVWFHLKGIELPELEQHAVLQGGLPRRVSFLLNPERKNRLVVLDSLQHTRIVPRHVIEPLLAKAGNDMKEFLKNRFDEDPVVSGPFKLHSYSSEKIVTERRDDYWGNTVFFGGKKAVPKYLIHSIYKSNDQFSVALRQGRLDVSTTFIPRIWLKHKHGVHSWLDEPPFYMPSAQTTLFANVMKRPLDDVHYRRAIALSIEYDDIRELAVSGYSPPLKSGLVLPFGLEAKYYSEEDAKRYGASYYDPQRAKAELRAGGYQPVFDSDGKLVETRDASGKRLPTIIVKSPSGWTDWESIVRVVVRGLRAAGIDAREGFVDGNSFWTAVFTGDFDLVMYNPSPIATPSKPWSRFNFALTSENWAPVGEKMYRNFGRFNDPRSLGYVKRFDELLALIPTLEDGTELTKAYRELNVLFMQYQPQIPLVYRPDLFYEFSERVWAGFPTSDRPFLPPQMPADRLGTRLLWHLRPVSQ